MMSSTAEPAPESWLEQYIRMVGGLPLLSPEEEQCRVRALGSAAHAAAARTLVLSHLALVVSIARDYQRYEQPFADLIQEGNVSLITAVDGLNHQAGYRLSSFLSQAINAGISRFVLDNWGIVGAGTSKEQQRLFVRLRGFKRGMAKLSASEVKAAAAYLRVKEEEILRLDQRIGGGDIPFVTGPRGIRHRQLLQSNDTAPGDGMVGVENLQWSQRRSDDLLLALSGLDDRARHIVEQRWLNGGKKVRLRDLAQAYRVSGERIRQIQGQAFDTMRPLIR
jgi:RNA polymerase sigma-32 factor